MRARSPQDLLEDCMQRPTFQYPKDLGLHLGGEWVTGARDGRPVLDPATGQSLMTKTVHQG